MTKAIGGILSLVVVVAIVFFLAFMAGALWRAVELGYQWF